MYTTTYTITSCPPFDRACSTGLVTTQTMSGSAVTTQTSSSGDGNDNEGGGDGDSDGDGDGDGDGDDGAGAGEDAGVHGQALSLVLLAMGVLAGGMYNVL